jgi:phospholipase C
MFMDLKTFLSHTVQGVRIGSSVLAVTQLALGATMVNASQSVHCSGNTRTPIKHVIVIVGENRSFDHIFATYEPKGGEKVWNLLSEGIINKNGSPGPNFYKAEQHAAADPTADAFLLSPAKSSFPNNVLPAPLVGGPKDSYVAGDSLTLAQ